MQLDIINDVVYADIDKIVFMSIPSGYRKNGKVLHLNKALYGLKYSSVLWQQKLTNKLRKLNFKEIS